MNPNQFKEPETEQLTPLQIIMQQTVSLYSSRMREYEKMLTIGNHPGETLLAEIETLSKSIRNLSKAIIN